MLKKIPKIVKYLGYTIRVEEISQGAMDEVASTQGLSGLWADDRENGNYAIYLVKELSAEAKWNTFWHEMGHAYMDISDHDMMGRRML